MMNGISGMTRFSGSAMMKPVRFGQTRSNEEIAKTLSSKVDPYIRMGAADYKNNPIPALMEVDKSVTQGWETLPESRKALEEAGFAITSQIGTILAGRFKNFEALAMVDKLAFVKRIEGSRPLYTE